eukprot:9483490-Pyramimonas_sp.AAC.1
MPGHGPCPRTMSRSALSNALSTRHVPPRALGPWPGEPQSQGPGIKAGGSGAAPWIRHVVGHQQAASLITLTPKAKSQKPQTSEASDCGAPPLLLGPRAPPVRPSRRCSALPPP